MIKIYDASKEYLTQSDKVKQFKDTEPGEVLTSEISFDIPADYAGTYYYRINLELKDGSIIESRYFQLQVRPPPPVPKPKLTGSVKSGYQASSTSESVTSVNLYLVNKLPEKRYLKFTGIGTYTFKESPRLGNLLLYYRGKGVNVSLGDVRDALCYLTLDRIEGLKVDTELGRFKLIATAGRKEQISSGTRPSVYGLGVAVKPISWFDLGVNYIIFSPEYKLTQTKTEKDRTATSLGLSYFLTKRSILQLRYGVTGRGTATNWKEKVSEQGNFSLDYTYEFDQNRRLVLKSTWMSSRNFETETSSEKSGLSFSYEYHF